MSEYILSSHEASNLEPNSLQIVYVPLDSNTHNQYFHGFKVTFWPPFGGTDTTVALLINPSQKSPVNQQVQHDSPAWGQMPSRGAIPPPSIHIVHADTLQCLWLCGHWSPLSKGSNCKCHCICTPGQSKHSGFHITAVCLQLPGV